MMPHYGAGDGWSLKWGFVSAVDGRRWGLAEGLSSAPQHLGSGRQFGDSGMTPVQGFVSNSHHVLPVQNQRDRVQEDGGASRDAAQGWLGNEERQQGLGLLRPCNPSGDEQRTMVGCSWE